MEKIKLTPAQIDAIDKALSHYGDADYLVKMHRNVILNGHEWSIWSGLNDLSPDVLERALKYGYEVDKQPNIQHSTGTFEENRNELLAIYDSIGKTEPVAKQQSTAGALQAELDYELASLSQAINKGDEVEVARSKQRLAEIHGEMEGLGC